MEKRGMSRNLLQANHDRLIFRSGISSVVALMLLAASMSAGLSPSFAQTKGEACKASFLNKCLADCKRRAGRQCDWFCGRRSTYAC
jgi:hypothetical protein